VNDVHRAAQALDRFRAEEAVRVGDETDADQAGAMRRAGPLRSVW
jgi:hypothetical protein